MRKIQRSAPCSISSNFDQGSIYSNRFNVSYFYKRRLILGFRKLLGNFLFSCIRKLYGISDFLCVRSRPKRAFAKERTLQYLSAYIYSALCLVSLKLKWVSFLLILIYFISKGGLLASLLCLSSTIYIFYLARYGIVYLFFFRFRNVLLKHSPKLFFVDLQV